MWWPSLYPTGFEASASIRGLLHLAEPPGKYSTCPLDKNKLSLISVQSWMRVLQLSWLF